jgi:hypothetical protein
MKVEIEWTLADLHKGAGYHVEFELGGRLQFLGPYSTVWNAKRGFKRWAHRSAHQLMHVHIYDECRKEHYPDDSCIEWEIKK